MPEQGSGSPGRDRGLEALRGTTYRVLDPLTDWMVRRNVHPNLLTTLGFAVTVVAGAFYAVDHVRTAGFFVLIGGVFDIFDGRVARPVYNLERAAVIVSLDADLLLTEDDAVAHTRGFADGRRIRSAADKMNRLYVVEPGLTSTGAVADHRLAVRGSRVRIVAELCGQSR